MRLNAKFPLGQLAATPGALEAMKASFSGCARNIWPFLLYGVVFLLLFIVALIPVGLGLLVVSPMIWTSIYTGYRDIYLSK